MWDLFPKTSSQITISFLGLGCLRFQDKYRSICDMTVLVTAEPLRAERLYGQRFVVLHIEDCVELCDLQQVVDLLGQVQQF